MIRAAALLLALLMLPLVGCKKEVEPSDTTKLSFKAALSYDYLKGLDDTYVTINGYMATSSPVDGSFMFLMNLPYQSCPFCVPNTSQLSNTIEIYPKDGEAFSYTAQAIRVVGRLVVAEDPDKPFTDKYGYEFNYKIVDATYTVIKSEELSADMALWQEIASSGVIDEIYQMFDYVNFLTAWDTYFVNAYTTETGEKVNGYYLRPSHAAGYLYNDGAQFNYGYKEGYFDGIVTKIEAIDPAAFAELVANVRRAEALATRAIGELEAENYTFEYKYVEKFGCDGYIYTLTNGAAMQQEMNDTYAAFANWLGSWEM
jgi:hypothetical protein